MIKAQYKISRFFSLKIICRIKLIKRRKKKDSTMSRDGKLLEL